MILRVQPSQRLSGKVFLPASKSFSIRALIIAACGGVSWIEDLSDCDDALAALRTAKALGARVVRDGAVVRVNALGAWSPRPKTFDVGESGTTLRFLLPLLPEHLSSALVKGRGTLVGRPNAHLCQALRACGLDIRGAGPKESVPIVFKGGRISRRVITIDGSLSSQFISAFLIALPRLKQESRLRITGKQQVSRDYITMTLQVLSKAGVKVRQVSEREFSVKGRQTFKGLKHFKVPSDYGLAAFPMAAAALVPSKVTLNGHWDDRLAQSDGRVLGFFKAMGVQWTKTSSAIRLQGPFALKGGVFSLKDCPDLVPVMAVMALFARGRTVLNNIHHARAKESDRLSDLRKELLKVGADVRETRNTLTIVPKSSYQSGQILDAHQDHRLAMAFAVLGLKIGCRVKGIESCRKSYPGFVRDLRALGAF